MKLGAAIAIGIGLGAAFASSMGAAGWALGLGTAILAFWAVPRLRNSGDQGP
jgi:hypothetical protein